MPHSRPSPPLCGPSRLRRLCSLAVLLASGPALADEAAMCPDAQAALRLAATGPVNAPRRPAPNEPIDVDADQLTYHLNGDISMHGNVKVRQGERAVQAQDAQYDAATQGLNVKGSLRYEDPIIRVIGTDGHYSASGGASFNSAQFELKQRAARGTAQVVEIAPNGVLDLKGVTFTTCPIQDRSWELHAGELTLDTGERLGKSRDSSVEFQGVPVMYLPWMSFPLGNERKSGFLFPSIGNTTRSGAQLAVPYYWNIAPNADLTFDPIIYSRRGVDLSGDARYITQNQSGELEWHYLPDDRLFSGDDRSFVSLKQTTELPDDFRLHIDAANVSDTQYFQDFAQGPEGTSTAFVERRAELTYRDEHWNLAAQMQQYQVIDLLLADVDRPYARVPRLTASGEFASGPLQLLHYGFESEVVNFDRSTGVIGWRADISPHVGLALEGPGYFVRPDIAWRYTQYELDDTAGGAPRSPSRTLPIASFDTGLIFERSAGNNEERTLTLEPRLLYLNVPYRNQDQLPVFDTALPDLNLVELFRTNRYVGADRVSDANQLSVGVTSRLVDTASGRQFLAATLGQTIYFEPPRVTLPGEVATTTPHSDLVAELALTAYKNWYADAGIEWNSAASRSDRTFVQVQFKPGNESVINLAYRYQRSQLDQVEFSGAWPVARSWNGYARLVYALDTHESLDSFAGFEYHACCWKLRVLGRRFLSNSTGRQDTGIFVQLELAGLASVGSAADTFLSTAIRGYSRPDTTR